MAMGTPRQAILPTVPRAVITVVRAGRIRVEQWATPRSDMVRSVSIANTPLNDGVSFAVNQGIPPSQYSGTEVRGVPPLMISTTSAKAPTCQPRGTGTGTLAPRFAITKRSGNRSETCLGKPVARPSILARTGSKSTNHDLNSARAIAANGSFMRRFSSILSSSAPSTRPISRCSETRFGRRTISWCK